MLVTPGDDKYVLEPGKELPISIQLRYPAVVGQKPECAIWLLICDN